MRDAPVFFCEDQYGKDFWKPMIRILLVEENPTRFSSFDKFRFVHFYPPPLTDPNRWHDLIRDKATTNAWKVYFIIDFDKICHEPDYQTKINRIKNEADAEVEFFTIKNCLESLICLDFHVLEDFVQSGKNFNEIYETNKSKIQNIFERNGCHKRFLKDFFKHTCTETYKESTIPQKVVKNMDWKSLKNNNEELSNFIESLSSYWDFLGIS